MCVFSLKWYFYVKNKFSLARVFSFQIRLVSEHHHSDNFIIRSFYILNNNVHNFSLSLWQTFTNQYIPVHIFSLSLSLSGNHLLTSTCLFTLSLSLSLSPVAAVTDCDTVSVPYLVLS